MDKTISTFVLLILFSSIPFQVKGLSSQLFQQGNRIGQYQKGKISSIAYSENKLTSERFKPENANSLKVNQDKLSNSFTGIEDGWFLVNNEKFLVKGVCVFDNHWIDEQQVFNTAEIWNYEFAKIKEAGFNTVSGWFSEEALEIAKNHGLMVLTSTSHLTFIDIYTFNKNVAYQKIREVMQYSKDFDNILSYSVDNEPIVNGMDDHSLEYGIYKAGEEELIDFYKNMIDIVKEYKNDAISTMTTFPQAGFLDYSIFDCIHLNLYPFAIQDNSIGYKAYCEWFKHTYAENKPLIISEYGVGRDLENPKDLLWSTLDNQICGGATGSFFYMWRAWGDELEEPNMGIIPNNGLPDDYMNTARPIFGSFQKYFEAVIVEPKREKVYSGILPIKVYGNDNTNSIEVIFDGDTYNLTKTGTYWWEKDILVGSITGEQTIIVKAKDKNSNLLVEKKVIFYVLPTKKQLTVKINESALNNKTFTAKIAVKNQDNQAVGNQSLHFGIHQSAVDMWASEVRHCTTDENGEYEFIYSNAVPGYFTLMTGVEISSEYPESLADVLTLKIEKEVTLNKQLGNKLDANYFEIMPNPAQIKTFLKYNITNKSNVNIKIMNLSGKTVKSVFNKIQQVGNYTLGVDLQEISAGIYLICIILDSKVQFKKLIIDN